MTAYTMQDMLNLKFKKKHGVKEAFPQEVVSQNNCSLKVMTERNLLSLSKEEEGKNMVFILGNA